MEKDIRGGGAQRLTGRSGKTGVCSACRAWGGKKCEISLEEGVLPVPPKKNQQEVKQRQRACLLSFSETERPGRKKKNRISGGRF